MHQIKVINGSTTPITDRYDGIPYNFPAQGAGTNMDLEAAQHIFGVDFPADAQACASEEFRAKIFNNLCRRWGWNTSEKNRLAVGQAIFKKIAFIPLEMKVVEMVSKNEDLPLPRGDKTDMIEDADAEEEAV